MSPISPISPMKRRPTTVCRVGNIAIGGDNPIRIQSMATTDTNDTEAGRANNRRVTIQIETDHVEPLPSTPTALEQHDPIRSVLPAAAPAPAPAEPAPATAP